MIFRLDANYAPTIDVYDSRYNGSLFADILLWNFYKENREIFQSGDNEAILKTIKAVGGFPQGKINPNGTYTG
jgi:hypothetical protein